MGKLVAVVGNSGVGKTSLVKALCRAGDFLPAFEQHGERPFQALFAAELAQPGPTRYGLANQFDYLLLRAEHEQVIRRSPGVGIHDGGLDLDFHGFARLFHHKGYLTDAEFALCARLYATLRTHLPPPDLVIALHAPLSLVEQRFRRRARALEITAAADLPLLGQLIDAWLATLDPQRVLHLPAADDLCTPASVARIHAALQQRLAWP